MSFSSEDERYATAIMARSYHDYVFEQSLRNPCLQNLCQFLHLDRSMQPCRVTCLEFYPDRAPVQTDLDLAELQTLLDGINDDADDVLGRLLVVEDLSRSVIEILGAALSIDPLFFGSHISSPKMEVTRPLPSTVTLPSKMKKQNFVCLQYHRVLEFENDPGVLGRVVRDGNVPRKVVILPPIKGKYIGLAQFCCSTLLTRTPNDKWLGETTQSRKHAWIDCCIGVILVDAPTTCRFLASGAEIILQPKPFQGGYEDFLECAPYSKIQDANRSGPWRRSLLEDLVFYWMKEHPATFNFEDPTILSLAYYPLKIVSAEWVGYLEVMSHSIKQYEYSTEMNVAAQALAKLDEDLHSLQSWGRRCMQSLHKLRSVVEFIRSRTTSKPGQEEYVSVAEDYEYIAATVDLYGRRLESMVPVVMSMVQIADTRRSLREASNVTRLTNLALLFVPLSFVTGLLSMNDALSMDGLRVYSAVAVPLCVVVFIIAHTLPFFTIHTTWNAIQGFGKDPRPTV